MNNQDVLNYCHEMLLGNSEVQQIQNRNIVSRAYYFTYYECVDHIQKRLGWNETTQNGGVHARVLSRLLDKTSNDPQKIEQAALIHNRMNNLKKLRVRADYKLEVMMPRTTAQYCVCEAEQIGIGLSSL
jgi:hypothetical protein